MSTTTVPVRRDAGDGRGGGERAGERERQERQDEQERGVDADRDPPHAPDPDAAIHRRSPPCKLVLRGRVRQGGPAARRRDLHLAPPVPNVASAPAPTTSSPRPPGGTLAARAGRSSSVDGGIGKRTWVMGRLGPRAARSARRTSPGSSRRRRPGSRTPATAAASRSSSAAWTARKGAGAFCTARERIRPALLRGTLPGTRRENPAGRSLHAGSLDEPRPGSLARRARSVGVLEDSCARAPRAPSGGIHAKCGRYRNLTEVDSPSGWSLRLRCSAAGPAQSRPRLPHLEPS